jgi:hypothetical protein
MKNLVLTLTSAFVFTACGAADEATLAEEGTEGTIASESEALVNQWTALVSEEAPLNNASCGNDGNVGATRARCTGSYCDNMALFCGTIPAGWGAPASGLLWTSYVSEEQPGGVMCPDNGLVARILDGIRVTGSYGDNVSVRCRSASIPPMSQMNCGWTPYFSEEQNIQEFQVQHL